MKRTKSQIERLFAQDINEMGCDNAFEFIVKKISESQRPSETAKEWINGIEHNTKKYFAIYLLNEYFYDHEKTICKAILDELIKTF